MTAAFVAVAFVPAEAPAAGGARGAVLYPWIRPSQAIAARAFPEAAVRCPRITLTVGPTHLDALAEAHVAACAVRVSSRRGAQGFAFSRAYLCTAIVHEYGHLAGYEHGGSGIMAAYLMKLWKPCAKRFPRRAGSRGPWWAARRLAMTSARRAERADPAARPRSAWRATMRPARFERATFRSGGGRSIP